MRRLFLSVTLSIAGALPGGLPAQAPASLGDSAFAALVVRLSDVPGFFDTDNIISNEDAYLHVVGTLKRRGVTGGAYLGVGPDQNFSYIAAVRPEVAFIVDIRRDNLLEHVLFKEVFALSRNRIEYLCLLFGRAAPADTSGWGARDVRELVAYVDTARSDTGIRARAQTRVLDRARASALHLSRQDLATIGRFHSTFIQQGLGLRFNSFGRAPQSYYPDYRRLILETDRTGRQSSFLAHETDFQVVKSLEDRNLVVPIIGDFGAPKAIRAVGDWLREHHLAMTVFYTSNVEQYLMQNGTFDDFAANVAALPRSPTAVMIRSYFMGGHPLNVSGYHVTQVAQPVDRFVALEAQHAFTSYFALVTRDVITP
ncbi:MAG TPA: hypothetical protein VE967_01300 [Gemmatimonadaceae bacterium]|nr:hypothetical protein [Gemmatimonadaceae bacterium]